MDWELGILYGDGEEEERGRERVEGERSGGDVIHRFFFGFPYYSLIK